ncbi:hypothetical protein QWZ14_03095 [Paeniroseomonas aquatica]|uniref:KfrA N-terminal DNA-binding domain-containing protein n=1 Tax=Paeniroseomonas aquatica TaxID=373043 RepID=A0ABT8A0X8_9PROT|nr:hypothetical protein [Paeniroseomonas aquatica]MDN3563361.1 hypothetical protein [Paeniroseomonas aquatica]
MSEQTAPKAAKLSPEEAKLEAQRIAAEQKALGRVRVAGWVPRPLAKEAEALLAALLEAGREATPPAAAPREDPAAAARWQQAQQALEAVRADATEAAAALDGARGGDAEAGAALEAARAEAARLRQEAAAAAQSLAESERHRSRAEGHLAEALATLRQLQPLSTRLKQPGLRTALARRLLG